MFPPHQQNRQSIQPHKRYALLVLVYRQMGQDNIRMLFSMSQRVATLSLTGGGGGLLGGKVKEYLRLLEFWHVCLSMLLLPVCVCVCVGTTSKLNLRAVYWHHVGKSVQVKTIRHTPLPYLSDCSSGAFVALLLKRHLSDPLTAALWLTVDRSSLHSSNYTTNVGLLSYKQIESFI